MSRPRAAGRSERVIPGLPLFSILIFSREETLRGSVLYLYRKNKGTMKKLSKPLGAICRNINSSKSILNIAKSLRKTIESKFNTLIYRLLDLPKEGRHNAEFQMPSPSLSHGDIDRLLFESQERNLAVEAQIKSLNAEINDLYRVIEESKRR